MGDFITIALFSSILGVMLVTTAILLRDGSFTILDPLVLFWAGAFICYVWQPFLFEDLFRTWQLPGVFEETLFWAAIALLCVSAGYLSRYGVRAGRSLPRCPRSLDSDLFFIVAVVWTALGVAGYAFMVGTTSGVEEWLSLGRGGTDYDNLSGYLTFLADFLPFGVLLLLFHAEFHRVPPPHRFAIWIAGSLMLLFFVYLGTRSRTISFALGMLAAHYLPRKRSPSPIVCLVGFVVIFTVVNFQALYRDKFTDLSFNVDPGEAFTRSLPIFVNVHRDAAAESIGRGVEFNSAMTVVALVPDVVDYNYGYGFLEIFTRPIPRAWWPDKIYPAAEAVQPILLNGQLSESWITTSSAPLLAGPSLTFVGHWYAVGGGIALVVASFMTGVMFRAIRTVLDREPGNEGDMLLYVLLMTIGFGEALGTPLHWVYILPFPILALSITFYFVRKRGVARNEGSRQIGDNVLVRRGMSGRDR